jgi:hypothetical protein
VFVASKGAYGASVPQFPAFSPNIVSVGGTSLSVNADSSYQGEIGWGNYDRSLDTLMADVGATAAGSGTGASLIEEYFRRDGDGGAEAGDGQQDGAP